MLNQPNKSGVVIFRSTLVRNSIADVCDALYDLGLGKAREQYDIFDLGNRKYVIEFKNPPDNYLEALEQFGELIY